MKTIRKPVAVFLAATVLYGIFSIFGTVSFAAPDSVNISVVSYSDGKLTIRWDMLSDARSAEITYHRPGTGGTATFQKEIVAAENTYTIEGLQADYIYDICVTLYNNVDPSAGEAIGRGLLYFLPAITFTATAPKQPYEDIPGGGREIGGTPKLRLNWKQPRMYYDSSGTATYEPGSGTFIGANSEAALDYMRDSYKNIYDDRDWDKLSLDYMINISTDANKLDSGSSVVIEQQADFNSYSAYVSGTPAKKAVIPGANGSSGYYSFELLGRRDEKTDISNDVDGDDILPHNGIFPGTVYYMKIIPIYSDSNGDNVPAVRVGDPDDKNWSILAGSKPYISTPIRFQLTKDSFNNVYVKIYRINQGSLDLPRLFYQVQSSVDDTIPGDWHILDTLDDSYFSGEYAVTVITGVSPDNKVFYKIVVKSEGAEDRLESLPLEYMLVADTDRPPLPTGVTVINRALNEKEATDPSGTVRKVKSTDITLSWEKPINWDSVKDDLVYHFLLSTSQTDPGTGAKVPVYVDGKLWGRPEGYESKYRLVKYISANSSRIRDVGNRLEFTLDGFELFDLDGDPATPPVLGTDDEGYPTFLIPNTVYYIQMYTTKAKDAGTSDRDKMSDLSVVASFTTLAGFEADVPLPPNFSLGGNGKLTSGGKVLNYIDLSFSKVQDLDWRNYTSEYDESKYQYDIYYDIFMNMGANRLSFIPVGTTQELQGDVLFTGADDPRSSVVTARIWQFTDDGYNKLKDVLPNDATSNPADKFGSNLLPNTTYYFLIRTRLVITNKQDPDDIILEKTSMFSSLLPVTTTILDVTPPDDSQRRPLAPTDFSIAVDAEGEQLLSDSSVTFSWTHREKDVIYQIVRTTGRVHPMAEQSEYENDPEYLSFLDDYDPLQSGGVFIDPEGDPQQNFPGKFTYDSSTGICRFTVDRGMFPNRLYYFSIKAIKVGTDRKPVTPPSHSVWVSVPVTTSFIEAPSMLEAVPGAEIGFFWTDSSPAASAEDYTIWLKGPGDAAYKPMSKAQATIIRDPDRKTYYGRITGLKHGSSYSVKVTRGSGTTVYEKTDFTTRDSYHELEIKWMGKLLDDYASYEIAIMEEGGSEYTVLTAADLEWYIDKNGSVLPYYTEETARTVGNDRLYYHARIKSMDVTLPGGIVTKQPLKSNTRYYIKVRSKKRDPVYTDIISYSKYIGPVSIRTEFSQEDYDNTDREEQQRAEFLEKMDQLERGYFWRIAIGTNNITSIMLKGDRVADAMRNSPGDSFMIDISEISANIERDEIYIPVSLLNVMKSIKKSLIIRSDGTEVVLRPYTLDAVFNETVKGIRERQEVKELYIKLDLRRENRTDKTLPSGMIPVSAVNGLGIQAMGFSIAYEDMASLFHDRLYNKDTGLVGEKLSMLLNTYVGSGAGSASLIDQYTGNLVNLIEKELSVYIDNTIKAIKLTNTVREINAFDSPVSVRLKTGESGELKSAYVKYNGMDSWRKATISEAGSIVALELLKPGTFVILVPDRSFGGIPEGHWARDYIVKMASKYDLESVFQGARTNFMPEVNVTCREIVLLYELTTGKAPANTGLNTKTRLTELGLDDLLHPNSLAKDASRQQTAAVLARLLAARKGTDPRSLRPRSTIAITDEKDIDDQYYMSVLIVVDINVMQLDASGRFRPRGTMTRAEAVAAFARLLELTGEL